MSGIKFLLLFFLISCGTKNTTYIKECDLMYKYFEDKATKINIEKETLSLIIKKYPEFIKLLKLKADYNLICKKND